MVVTLFFGLGAGTIFVFVPTFADSLGIETLALFYTAFALAAIGVRVFGGRLIDTHGRRAVIVPSMFLQTGATALLAVLGFLVTRTSLTPIVPVLIVIGSGCADVKARRHYIVCGPARHPARSSGSAPAAPSRLQKDGTMRGRSHETRTASRTSRRLTP